MNTTVLVTGGAGYIGSHTCKALSKAGFQPVVYDNLSTGNRWAVRWGPLEVGDITDRQRLDEVLKRYRPRAVMHFAGSAYVGESVENPGKYYRNNVLGSLTLLESMRDWDIEELVFSSTCATYGLPLSLPLDEQHPQNPINPYGRSKWMVERMIADFVRTYGLRSVILRYFNAAGADPSGEIGEWHRPETHLIPLAIGAALGQQPPLTVFGDDYPTPDGTCIRDYVHVSDLADGHVLAVSHLQEKPGLQIYNMGNARGFSVSEVIAETERITGAVVPYRTGPRRVGDPPELVCDNRLIYRALGWRAQFDQLSDIIETAWKWMRNQLLNTIDSASK